VSPAREAAPDDIVADFAAAAANARPPLLVTEPLRRFLTVAGLGEGELSAREIGDGHSCVTFLVEHGERRLVLRRPPRPPVPPSTHDVIREARVMRALRDSDVPVPAVLAVCTDEAVIGSPFFVMEEVEGHVPTDSLPPALESEAERRRVGYRMVETLDALQRFDWRGAELEGFGRPQGYLERQLRRFGELWETNRTRDLPAVGRVAEWLAANLPESAPATIVHGDYRLGNAMFGLEAPARVAAMLDWEMSTLGDPLADLGLMVIRWVEPGDPETPLELSPVTRLPGFPSRAELVARYEELSGHRADAIAWYATLALWKSVVFMEGNYKRTLVGASDDPYVSRFRDGVVEIAAWAERVGPGGQGLG
jgi:aminoglycoside phosphotransferase (APT) family kinase protein